MGAWIETTKGGSDVKFFWVAPFMGAWIETPTVPPQFGNLVVAPFMGAWIETAIETSIDSLVVSHPSWVRGLKQKNS